MKNLKLEEIVQIKKPLGFYKLDRRSLSGNKLLAVSWIWKCYSAMGYNPFQRTILMLFRGFFQILLYVIEISAKIYNYKRENK